LTQLLKIRLNLKLPQHQPLQKTQARCEKRKSIEAAVDNSLAAMAQNKYDVVAQDGSIQLLS